MAKKLKPDDGPATAKHNVAGLHKLIRAEDAKFTQIEDKRAALNTEAAESRQRLRDAGLQTKVFEHHRRLLKLEEEAQQAWLDDQALIMEALPIGTQLDLLETVGEDLPADVAGARRAADEAGFTAGIEGKANIDNPHRRDDPLKGVWQGGWLRAQRQRADEMGPKGAAAKPKRGRNGTTRAPEPPMAA